MYHNRLLVRALRVYLTPLGIKSSPSKLTIPCEVLPLNNVNSLLTNTLFKSAA